MTDCLAKLEALGKTPEEVAAALRAAGIKGERGSMCHCPLAMYLRSLGAEKAEVGSYVFYPTGEILTSRSVQLPEACSDFIDKFDCEGAFDDLATEDYDESYDDFDDEQEEEDTDD